MEPSGTNKKNDSVEQNEPRGINPLRFLQPRSIETKIGLFAGLCLIAAASVIIAYAAFSLRAAAIETAKQRAIAEAETKSVSINEEMEVALNAARLLAQALSGVKDTEDTLHLSREQAATLLRKILVENPHFVGVYTLWEPNAFDKKDLRYQDAEGHDATGRFMVYWNRQGSSIAREQLHGYDDREVGAYYQCSKRIRIECITEPYMRSVQGEQMFVSSLSVPIIVNGEFLGVAGVDIRLDFFQTLADNVDMYDGEGQFILLTHEGTIVAVTGQPELIGHYAKVVHPDFDSDNELERIQNGEWIVEFYENDDLEIFVPLYFGRSLSHWSVSIIIPGDKMTAHATRLMWRMIAIGFGLMVVALSILWFVARQIAVPVRQITKVAQQVADGHLDVQADVKTRDETGVLATVFNQMITNLHTMMEDNRKANEALTQQNNEQRRLLELVSALETPTITLADGVLFAPVVGTLDSLRAQNLMARLLDEVHARQVRQVIIDITGVTMVDTQVAHALLQMIQALRLLGCEVTMTGITAGVATTITQLGISLEEVATYHSPQEVLSQMYPSGH